MVEGQKDDSMAGKITREAMRYCSRRGFLGVVGKGSVTLLSLTGLASLGLNRKSLIAHAAASTNYSPANAGVKTSDEEPDCVQHPGDCFGPCVDCCPIPSCSTGGSTCYAPSCTDCFTYEQRTHGYYDCYGHFHCEIQTLPWHSC